MSSVQRVERMTPLDLLMPGGYIGAVLTFQTRQSPSALLPIFEQAIQVTCEQVPWLRGRVIPVPAVNEEAPSLQIQWSVEDGAPQVIDKGSIPATYKDLSHTGMPLSGVPADIWPVQGHLAIDSSSLVPVFAAGLFQFADAEAVGLCIQAHHNITDGFGFGEIVKLLARNMSTNSNSSSPGWTPSEERNSRLTKALAANTDSITSLSLDALFQKHPEYSRIPPDMPTETSACTAEILTIPMSKIQTLKDTLKGYMDKIPTTNTLACVLLWSAITRARMRRTHDYDAMTTRLPMAVNGRRRLNMDLVDPKNPYMGNMVLFSFAEREARDVANCGTGHSMALLAEVCQLVAQAQSADQINARHIGEVYSLVQKTGNYTGIFPGWALFSSRDLFITSWADLDLYDLDFGQGLGKPRFIRIPYAEADGNAIVLPRKRDASGLASMEEGLEVVVMLRRDDLAVLKEDSLWI